MNDGGSGESEDLVKAMAAVDDNGTPYRLDRTVRFPTRIQKIGNCVSFFCSCYKYGQVPYMQLGPDC